MWCWTPRQRSGPAGRRHPALYPLPRRARGRWLSLSCNSFCIEPGQTVEILGTVGSGKSTLVNLISRFYDVTADGVKLDGHDMRDVTLSTLRSQIGIVLQETRLFSGSIRDNIAFGKLGAPDEEVREAARDPQADDFIRELPDGCDTVIGERGAGSRVGSARGSPSPAPCT